MKFSLTLAALILAVASYFGWRDHQTLSAARADHQRLVEEARALGLDPDGLLESGESAHPSKLAREAGSDRETDAKAFAKELVAFALEMKKLEEGGEQPGEEVQKRIFAMMERLLELDASQLKTLVTELRASEDLDDETRSEIVGFAVMMLGSDHPRAALALFTESADLFDKDGVSKHAISSSLSRWAQDDPLAALEWIRENTGKHPDLVTEESKRAVIAGAARQDPRLAFQLLGELDRDEQSQAVRDISRVMATPAERTALLSALRDHLESMDDDDLRQDLLKSTVSGLADQALRDGFDSATMWFDSASLSPDEAAVFVNSISPWQAKDDTGQWIDWMADKLPEEKLAGKVDQMMGQWTRSDYKAAGEWLNTAAAGPAKQAAVKSYAKTLAPYEPGAATQWALTLPAGKDRDEVLAIIEATSGEPDPDQP